MHGREHAGAVEKIGIKDAGVRLESRQRLGGAQDVEQLPSNHRFRRIGGDHGAMAVGDHNAAAGLDRERRQRLVDLVLQSRTDLGLRLVRAAIEPLTREVGDDFDVADRARDRMAPLIEHLQYRPDRDRAEKGNDQNRHRAPQNGLGGEKAPIRRLGDGLSQPLDRIRTHTLARDVSGRHPGLRSECPLPSLIGRMCRISPNRGHWNRIADFCRESPVNFLRPSDTNSGWQDIENTGAVRIGKPGQTAGFHDSGAPPS